MRPQYAQTVNQEIVVWLAYLMWWNI